MNKGGIIMENRKFVRVDAKLIIWYQTLEEDEISFGKPLSKNVSAGGILLELDDNLHVNTNLAIKFKIPNHEKDLHIKGKVVWSKKLDSGKTDVGIEFVAITDEDRKIIDEYASTHV